MKSTILLLIRAVAGSAAVLSLNFLLTSCDTTPRERQEIVRQEARKLDTLADRAGDKIDRASSRAADYTATARARNRQPLDSVALRQFTNELLGTYASVEKLTPLSIEPAYTQLLRQTRAKRREWTQRDWDYATSVYKRLNDRFKAIRLDVVGRDELRIRGLQAEFVAMEAGRDVKDLGEAMKDSNSN
jgi:predicted small secreted protein